MRERLTETHHNVVQGEATSEAEIVHNNSCVISASLM